MIFISIIIIFFIIAYCIINSMIKNAINCCSDCAKYKCCHGDSYDRNALECPACKNFQYKDF